MEMAMRADRIGSVTGPAPRDENAASSAVYLSFLLGYLLI